MQMITITDTRTRGTEPTFSPTVSNRSIERALEALLIFEIGYGSQIVSITPTQVKCVTYVLDCKDETTFDGSEEDMLLLVEAAITHVELQAVGDRTYHDRLIDLAMEITKGIPLMVKLGAGIILGGANLQVVMITMLHCSDVPTLQRLLEVPRKDLLAILLLVRKDNIDLTEALELASPVH